MTHMMLVILVLLGCLRRFDQDAKKSKFHISILGEVGFKESWTKLFIVGPLPGIEHPIGICKKGDIFFRKKDNELVWFDLSTQRIEELGVKGDSCCRIMIYKETSARFASLQLVILFSSKEDEETRLLQLDHVDLTRDYKCLSNDLRRIHWKGFTFNKIPDDFYQRNLVIDLKHSSIKQVWKKTKI
ncbi:hypothetical protein MTR_5g036250 [Medicago truncatula]|uniref:Uncharacterized protein n=1 Tax=Medicago truncatula TaxID=3880 RepID=G7K5J7_MEDTR|nr:hypothetical protein MTR_5g036250 [Medicago truncatula]